MWPTRPPAVFTARCAYNFNIGKYDVTLGQYVAFLNSVATRATPTACTIQWMATDCLPSTIGISQSGSPGSYSYAVTGTTARLRTAGLRRYLGRCGAFLQLAAKRPADQRHRGTGTTEAGAYTLNGATSERR